MVGYVNTLRERKLINGRVSWKCKRKSWLIIAKWADTLREGVDEWERELKH